MLNIENFLKKTEHFYSKINHLEKFICFKNITSSKVSFQKIPKIHDQYSQALLPQKNYYIQPRI